MRRGQNTISVTCAIDATVFCNKYISTNREPKVAIRERRVTSYGNTPCGKSKKHSLAFAKIDAPASSFVATPKLERRFGAMRRLRVRSRAAPPERPQPPPFRAAPSPPNPRPATRLGNPHDMRGPPLGTGGSRVRQRAGAGRSGQHRHRRLAEIISAFGLEKELVDQDAKAACASR
jgi:hypothetical protein